MDKSVLFIINPISGKKRIRTEMFGILSELENAGFVPTLYFTKYKGHATEIARSADPDKYSMVICSGGDGTLNETITGLIQSGHGIPFGYIPSGSTCDFANTLSIPKNMLTATQNITHGQPHKIDIGKFCDSYFSYVASFGLFTKASYSTDQMAKNLLGKAAYVLEGIKDLGAVHAHRMHIELDDGKEIDDVFIFGAVANSTSIGGIISIDPSEVALDDGEFEYLFVNRPESISDILLTIDALSSHNYQDKHLYFGSTKSLRISSEKELEWSLDGECAKPTSKVFEINNLHEAVSLILPDKKSPGLLS